MTGCAVIQIHLKGYWSSVLGRFFAPCSFWIINMHVATGEVFGYAFLLLLKKWSQHFGPVSISKCCID